MISGGKTTFRCPGLRFPGLSFAGLRFPGLGSWVLALRILVLEKLFTIMHGYTNSTSLANGKHPSCLASPLSFPSPLS